MENNLSHDAVSDLMPVVAVVVLNWNGLADTRDCLDSLLRSTYSRSELVVVDNGSSDNAVEVIAKNYPGVTLIATGENLGWAGGNNVGIRHALQARSDYVLLLNNDTVVEPDSITLLVEAARRAGPGLLHPSIYYFDEPSVPQLDPLAGQSGIDRAQLCSIEHAYGAALLLDRQVIEKVGYLDERFFLQLEEADYFRRARTCGFPSRVFPAAKIFHKESKSFGGRRVPLKTYYSIRNSLLLAAKHARGVRAPIADLKSMYWALTQLAAEDQGVARLSMRFFLMWLFAAKPYPQAVRAGVWDFCCGRFGRAGAGVERKLSVPRYK